MVEDEPAFWAAIPDLLKPKVQAAAIGMCRRSRDSDEDEPDYCAGCCEAADSPKHGGSCVAFGLWGRMALGAVEALEQIKETPNGLA